MTGEALKGTEGACLDFTPVTWAGGGVGGLQVQEDLELLNVNDNPQSDLKQAT